MFWLIAGGMTAAALALILRALAIGPAQLSPAGKAREIDVHRARLAELERDEAAGLVSAADAAATRLEIEHQLLKADRAGKEEAESASPAASAWARLATIVAVALTPVAAAGLYLTLGHPDQTISPESAPVIQNMAGSSQPMTRDDLQQAALRLEERLEAAPDNAREWAMLGWARTQLGDRAGAAEAYRKAATLEPDVAALQSTLGEALVLAADGRVTDEALESFARAQLLDSADVAARFYGGLAEYQRGRFREAMNRWLELSRDAPPDAPWLPGLRRQIADVARELGLDPETVLPTPESAERLGPTLEQMQSAAEMGDAERRAMIEGMVAGLAARLEENPDDAEGWKMLARSYRVLGETQKAAEAYRRLAELRPDDLDVQVSHALALLTLDDTAGRPLGDGTVAALESVIRLDKDNRQALFQLGRAAEQRGRREKAESYWQRLIELSPKGDPLRREAEAGLGRLSATDRQD